MQRLQLRNANSLQLLNHAGIGAQPTCATGGAGRTPCAHHPFRVGHGQAFLVCGRTPFFIHILHHIPEIHLARHLRVIVAHAVDQAQIIVGHVITGIEFDDPVKFILRLIVIARFPEEFSIAQQGSHLSLPLLQLLQARSYICTRRGVAKPGFSLFIGAAKGEQGLVLR